MSCDMIRTGYCISLNFISYLFFYSYKLFLVLWEFHTAYFDDIPCPLPTPINARILTLSYSLKLCPLSLISTMVLMPLLTSRYIFQTSHYCSLSSTHLGKIHNYFSFQVEYTVPFSTVKAVSVIEIFRSAPDYFLCIRWLKLHDSWMVTKNTDNSL